MQQTAEKIAAKIRAHDFVKIVTHIDADGITAGSIASIALTREGIAHEVEFVKKLDDLKLQHLKEWSSTTPHNSPLIWFTDLGSGQQQFMDGLDYVICDHHSLSSLPNNISKDSRIDLLKFGVALDAQQGDNHLNPHLFNHDGSLEISGAGTVYMVAKAMNPTDNLDLSLLAIMGAVGDLQDSRNGKLVGLNREILKDAENTGGLEAKLDIRFFGRETRPIYKLLRYANDPLLPGLQNSDRDCIAFLQDLGIALKQEERWRRWIDLDHTEKQTIISELIKLLLSSRADSELATRVIGEVYILTKETEGTALHDTKEFATLLNSCGRYKKAEVAYKICLGDRGKWLESAYKLLQGHRSILVESIQIVKGLGIKELDNIQYFHAEDQILDDIVGTVAGMILGSDESMRHKPLFGFAVAEDGNGIKVSARANRALLEKGLDLSKVMKNASEMVDGTGGGHNIAAGATIPTGKEEEFLKLADKMIFEQMNNN